MKLRSIFSFVFGREFQSLEIVATQVSNLWKIPFIALLLAGPVAFGEDAPNFEEHVKPILRSQCNQCHNPDKAKGGLDMSTYPALLRGASSGPIVTAGNADDSTMFLSIAHKHEPFMPKDGDRRPDSELDIIRKWIAGGLVERRGGTARVAEKSKVDLAISPMAGNKPEGPPPMPAFDSPPVFVSSRANAIRALAASPWAPLVAIGGEKQIVLYNSETFDLLATVPFPEGEPKVLRFSRNAKLLMCGGGEGGKSGRVVLWDVVSGSRVAELGDEYDTVLAADVRADQKLVALGGPQRVVRAFKTKDGEKAYEIRKHTDWVTAIEFSPDGILLATGDRNGGLYVWEADGGQPFYDLAGHQGAITKLSWRSDGNVLASASEDGTVRLWNAHDGKQIKSITAHAGGVLGVEFSRDGKLVTCGRDKLLKVWAADGKETQTISRFDDIVTSTVFTHNATRIVSGDWNGAVKVFAANDGGECGRLRANPPSMGERILDAMAMLEPAKKRADDLQALADQAKAALEEKTRALELSQKAVAEKAGRLQAAEAALAAAKKEIDGANAEVAAARQEFSNRDADLAARRDRARLASDREAKARTAHEDLQRQLAENSKIVEEMRKVVASARVAALPTKNDAALFDTIDSGEKKIKESGDEVALLNQRIPASAAEFEKIVIAAREANSVIKAGQDAVNEAKSALDQKQTAANQAVAKKDEAEKNLVAAKTEKENADKSAAEKQQKVSDAQLAATTANEAAASAKADLTNADRRSDKLKAEQFDALMKQAEAKLSAKGKGNFTLQQIVDAAQKAVEDIPPYIPPETNATKKTAVEVDPSKVERPARSLLFIGRFHIAVLHIPIGVLLIVVLLELDRLIRRGSHHEHLNILLLRFGAVFAVITAILGYLLALDPIYDPADLARHRLYGIAAAGLAVMAALFRSLRIRVAPAGYWFTLGSAACLMVLAGHEGGALTHGRDYLDEYLPDWVSSIRGHPRALMDAGGDSEFAQKIRPVLDGNCISCHGPQKQKGKLRLDQKAAAFAGGESGKKGIVPGDALKSELVRRLLLSRSDDDAMPPPNKPPLKPADIIAIVQWVNDGARWPDSPAKTNTVKTAAVREDKTKPDAAPKKADATGPATKADAAKGASVTNAAPTAKK